MFRRFSYVDIPKQYIESFSNRMNGSGTGKMTSIRRQKSAVPHPRIGQCNPERMLKHWRVLCREIGERRAGTQGERAAEEYLLTQFNRLALDRVHAEPFPCTSLKSS